MGKLNVNPEKSSRILHIPEKLDMYLLIERQLR